MSLIGLKIESENTHPNKPKRKEQHKQKPEASKIKEHNCAFTFTAPKELAFRRRTARAKPIKKLGRKWGENPDSNPAEGEFKMRHLTHLYHLFITGVAFSEKYTEHS